MLYAKVNNTLSPEQRGVSEGLEKGDEKRNGEKPGQRTNVQGKREEGGAERPQGGKKNALYFAGHNRTTTRKPAELAKALESTVSSCRRGA